MKKSRWSIAGNIGARAARQLHLLAATVERQGTTVCLILVVASITSLAELRPVQPRCEYRESPLGIESVNPHLSWTLESGDPEARDVKQTAYQVVVATTPEGLQRGEANLWDSGKVLSDAMAHIAYSGKPLTSDQACWWSVRVWDQDGRVSSWSAPSSWSAGVLSPGEWKAQWITAGQPATPSGPLPLFRREFIQSKPVQRASAHICGLGFYELSINARKVGDLVLDPGWTDYRKRCLYTTYDVTSFFQTAKAGPFTNTFGVMLGNGLFNVRGGRYTKFTGSFGPPQFILQIHLEYADGSSTNLVSDSSWRTAPGPITFSCIYGGEDYDARQEQPGWDRAGFNDNAWRPVQVIAGPGGRLCSQSAPPIQVEKTFAPTRVTEPKPGVFVYDLGQNFSGWPSIVVTGSAGTRVKIIPGELLDEAGFVTQRSSGGPVWFEYTLKGVGHPEGWQPRFSYYGFRYVQVEGAVPADRAADPAQAVLREIHGQFVHSSARRTSTFASSDDLLNRIDRLILNAVDSNLQSVLTDCPHREKLGWLEVSHLLGPALLFNYDLPLLYAKICDDMADSQLENGLVPDIAPEFTVFSGGFRDSPEWGSACAINPWLIYQRYGDRRPLQAHYHNIARYVTYLSSQASGHILSHGLGDWYDIGPKAPGESQLTSKGVTATAIYYQDIEILRQTADLLGKPDEARKWAALAADVRRAFNSRYFDADAARYDRGSQTANAMPLVLGLVEPRNAKSVLDQLVADVRGHGNQVTAGDVGFRYLVEALRTGGRSDVVFDLVTREKGPGYADQLRRGATSLTEAWDANPASSQNHCMLGHAEEWLYTGLAGINPDPDGPGFRKIIIQPQVVGTLSWVQASYSSVSGVIRSSWKKTQDQVTFEIVIPPNTTAMIFIPTKDPALVTEREMRATKRPRIQLGPTQPGPAVFLVGSGHYQFAAPLP